jgi:hypothetical protein
MYRHLCTVLVFLGVAYSQEFTGGVSYLGDNIGYVKTSYAASMAVIPATDKKVSVGIDYTHGRLKKQFSGLNTFTDDALSISAKYNRKGKKLSAGLGLDYGVTLIGDMRQYIALTMPLVWRMSDQPATYLMSTVYFRQGYADDSPMAQRCGAGKTEVSADIGVGSKGWELHGSYQHAWYGAIKRGDFESLLADTTFFGVFYDLLNPANSFVTAKTDPIPGHELTNASIYFFGPIVPWCYAGAAYSYRDADKDAYIPLADDTTGNIIYTYFPYRTPHKEWGISGIVALSKSIDNPRVPLSKFSLKLDVPIVSGGEYRGYYQVNPNMLLAGFKEFYYSCNGLEDMTIRASVGKSFLNKFSFGIDYTWFSRPYAPYHFFGKDSYQYHTVGIKVGKIF